MKFLSFLIFSLSLQAFALDWKAVELDFLQTKPGAVLGDQTLVVYYKACQAQRTFEWASIETKDPKIQKWVLEVVKTMAAGKKCD